MEPMPSNHRQEHDPPPNLPPQRISSLGSAAVRRGAQEDLVNRDLRAVTISRKVSDNRHKGRRLLQPMENTMMTAPYTGRSHSADVIVVSHKHDRHRLRLNLPSLETTNSHDPMTSFNADLPRQAQSAPIAAYTPVTKRNPLPPIMSPKGTVVGHPVHSLRK